MDVRIRCPVCKAMLCVYCSQPEHLPDKEADIYRRALKEWERDRRGRPTEVRYCYQCTRYFYGDDFFPDTTEIEASLWSQAMVLVFVTINLAMVLYTYYKIHLELK